MKCIRCGGVIVARHNPLYTTHEPEFCSDACEFLNRLRILRSLDSCEVPNLGSWASFRNDPYYYVITCSDDDAAAIWTALRKREE